MLQRPTPPGLLQQDQSHLIRTLIASAQPAVLTTPTAYCQSRKPITYKHGRLRTLTRNTQPQTPAPRLPNSRLRPLAHLDLQPPHPPHRHATLHPHNRSLVPPPRLDHVTQPKETRITKPPKVPPKSLHQPLRLLLPSSTRHRRRPLLPLRLPRPRTRHIPPKRPPPRPTNMAL